MIEEKIHYLKIEKEKSKFLSFYSLKVVPAFKELKTELEKHGRKVALLLEDTDIGTASILVRFKGKQEFSYIMGMETSQDRVSPRPYIYCRSHQVKSSIKDDSRMSDISKEDIIKDFLGRYKLCFRGII